MANTTNFGWETPDDTDLVKDGASAIRTLGNSIDTSLVDLKGGTTGQILSKASNTDLDYTWITNDVGDITEVVAGTGLSGGGSSGSVTLTNTVATTYDSKGDLVVGTGADTFSKLTVGTNNSLLVADSTQSTGLKWGGLWQTWTPTYGNLTIGNGTVVARYAQIGKTVNCFFKFTLGSTSSVGTIPNFSLPVTAAHSLLDTGIVGFTDAGVGDYPGILYIDTTTVYPVVLLVNGTYAANANVTATVPFTWNVNDIIVANFTYEAA